MSHDHDTNASEQGIQRPGHPRPAAAQDHEAAPAARILAFLALAELSSFERFSTDAQFAPNLEDKVALGGLAVAEYRLFEVLRQRLAALGFEAVALMEEMQGPLQAFTRQTRPGDWYESLMKSYVVDSIFRDVHREVITRLDEESRTVALAVVDHTAPAEYLHERLGEAVAEDELLAGRLALWGRRLVAESIRRGRETLLQADPEAPAAQIMSSVTEAHSKRMASLGLVA
ncbi:ferritin-like fold-containing protein [Sediminivirga luteola]|uniref:Ferritin-like domain-containing protein n=1 Tax=Sediminivirga luteola TaxID=1774748 RepID=A0A8J2XJN6_9MICO|nr:ferritin-like fold-containing protein [Sediminivirga luteola]MCI2265686.1 ferritin-like domain-containing protein [Sediminivirga luteola]GGA07423.1 hypothetical protein GCM10011333_07640 [Sediminivirga luteola]